jgi:hypothetical protein
MKQILLTLTAIFLIATFSIAQNIPSYVPTNGLVGWWPFNGNANDESGNGNNGVVNGATLTTDRFGNNGKAYSFDGYSKIQTLRAGPTGNGISLSFWYKTNNTIMMQTISYGSTNWGHYFGAYLNHYSAQTTGPCYGPSFTNAGTLVNKNTGSIQDSTIWHHAVIIIPNGAADLNSLLFYLDGQLLTGSCSYANYGAPSPYIDNGNPILIGGGWYSGVPYNDFNGNLDDIAIYNRALTQEEITSLYAGTVPCTATSSDTNLTIPNTALPYTWNGLTFNAAGTQTAHLTNACGADSAATLNLTVTNTLPSYLPTNGLVGWWPFNGNANDESGNGNIGTVNGATLTSDRFGNIGKAYRFDGNSNYITTSPIGLPIGNQSRTISSWFNTSTSVIPTNQYPNIQMINGYGSGEGGQVIFPQSVTASQGLAWFETGSSVNNIFSINRVNDGSWHNIVTTYNGPNSEVKMYIDGIYQGCTSLLNINTISSNFIIGGCPWATIFFKGFIDDIAIYNRALTQQEVTQLYNSCLAPLSSEFTAEGCEQYQLPWGENPVTASGDYLHTYQTTEGCDSTVTAHITINHSVAGASFNASGINTYTLPWGDTAMQSGYYTHLYQNEYGCDSLVTAYVVINSPADSSSHNIGINVDNPQRNLHIKDAIRLEPRNTPLNNPTKGDIYFDGSLNKLRVYDGTTWQNCW